MAADWSRPGGAADDEDEEAAGGGEEGRDGRERRDNEALLSILASEESLVSASSLGYENDLALVEQERECSSPRIRGEARRELEMERQQQRAPASLFREKERQAKPEQHVHFNGGPRRQEEKLTKGSPSISSSSSSS